MSTIAEALIRACWKRGLLHGTGAAQFGRDVDGFWFVGEYDPEVPFIVYRAIFCAEQLPEGCAVVIQSRNPATALPIFIVPEIANALGPDGPGTWPLNREDAALTALVHLGGTSTLPSSLGVDGGALVCLPEIDDRLWWQARVFAHQQDLSVLAYFSKALCAAVKSDTKVYLESLLELCPKCGIGIDTDGDGDCALCVRGPMFDSPVQD